MKLINSDNLRLYLVYHCCYFSHTDGNCDYYLNPRTSWLIGFEKRKPSFSIQELYEIFHERMDYSAGIEVEHLSSFIQAYFNNIQVTT